MNSILEKAINREPIEDKDIEAALHDICEDVHASCHGGCPVYEKHGKTPSMALKYGRIGCPFHKNGRLMLAYLRSGESLKDFFKNRIDIDFSLC